MEEQIFKFLDAGGDLSLVVMAFALIRLEVRTRVNEMRITNLEGGR